MNATQSKPSIVFCHGIWADGSSFSKVIPALQADGHEVIAAQYGLDTLAGDVATVKRTLGRVSSPAILVGHSYGGSVITAAGMDDRVVALVYIAALAPDADETSQSQQTNYPPDRRFLIRRSRRRATLDVAERRRVLRGRPLRAGEKGRLGHALRARRGPLHQEGGWHRLEIEAELVHRCKKRPHCATGPGTLLRQADERHHL
jgi:pimeloyl-ACP methyl ester carboxylesterase